MSGVLDAVRRANQRGGRMLSVLDLVDAHTLTAAQAAWLLARIEGGSSWLVGASPGGAGKTTIMGALLAMLPERSEVHVACEVGWGNARPGECVVAYEISPGDYDGYVWGPELRELAGLGERGCRLVSNLHADTLEQARDQLEHRNGLSPEALDRFRIFLPIRLDTGARGIRRTVPAMWHHCDTGWVKLEEPRLAGTETAILSWIERELEKEARTIEEVRSAWLVFRRDGSAAASG